MILFDLFLRGLHLQCNKDSFENKLMLLLWRKTHLNNTRNVYFSIKDQQNSHVCEIFRIKDYFWEIIWPLKDCRFGSTSVFFHTNISTASLSKSKQCVTFSGNNRWKTSILEEVGPNTDPDLKQCTHTECQRALEPNTKPLLAPGGLAWRLYHQSVCEL